MDHVFILTATGQALGRGGYMWDVWERILDLLYGSYLYPESQGPRYISAGIAPACVCGACGGLALVIRFVLQRENRRLERENGPGSGF